MRPARARKLLNAYLEGDLDHPTRSDLESALARDPELQRELRELRATVALLRGLPEAAPPQALAAQVMERVRAGEAAPTRFLDGLRRLLEPSLWLPATAACAALVVLWGTPDAGPREQSTSLQLADASESMDRERKRRELMGEMAKLHAERLARRVQRPVVTHILRGAGHPHSASFASHLDDEFDNIVFASFQR